MKRLLSRLWYAERRHWVGGHEPIAVNWPPGQFRMVVTGKKSVALSAWLHDGRVMGMMSEHPIVVDVEGELPVGAKAMHLEEITKHLRIESLTIGGVSMLSEGDRIALSMLKGDGWLPKYTPRWRVLIRGIADAFVRAFTTTEEPR